MKFELDTEVHKILYKNDNAEEYEIEIEKHPFTSNTIIIVLKHRISEGIFSVIEKMVSLKDGEMIYYLFSSDFKNEKEMERMVKTMIDSGSFELIRITSPGNTHIFRITKKVLLELI